MEANYFHAAFRAIRVHSKMVWMQWKSKFLPPEIVSFEFIEKIASRLESGLGYARVKFKGESNKGQI